MPQPTHTYLDHVVFLRPAHGRDGREGPSPVAAGRDGREGPPPVAAGRDALRQDAWRRLETPRVDDLTTTTTNSLIEHASRHGSDGDNGSNGSNECRNECRNENESNECRDENESNDTDDDRARPIPIPYTRPMPYTRSNSNSLAARDGEQRASKQQRTMQTRIGGRIVRRTKNLLTRLQPIRDGREVARGARVERPKFAVVCRWKQFHFLLAKRPVARLGRARFRSRKRRCPQEDAGAATGRRPVPDRGKPREVGARLPLRQRAPVRGLQRPARAGAGLREAVRRAGDPRRRPPDGRKVGYVCGAFGDRPRERGWRPSPSGDRPPVATVPQWRSLHRPMVPAAHSRSFHMFHLLTHALTLARAPGRYLQRWSRH